MMCQCLDLKNPAYILQIATFPLILPKAISEELIWQTGIRSHHVSRNSKTETKGIKHFIKKWWSKSYTEMSIK